MAAAANDKNYSYIDYSKYPIDQFENDNDGRYNSLLQYSILIATAKEIRKVIEHCSSIVARLYLLSGHPG